MQKRLPLGFIALESGIKPVYAFDDFFLNFMFEKRENWETLRELINILLEAYALECPGTVLGLITDEITVTTQFKNYLKNQHKPKEQDFVIKEVNIIKFTYVEVQNSAFPTKPIDERAMGYSALGISQNLGHISNQIWLMAEGNNKLLHGKTFANYLLKEESSEKAYSNTSCILFVNLKKLSNEKSEAGELASFLLGKTPDVKSNKARQVSDALKKGCAEFCRDKGVKISMSIKQKWQDEAKREGIEEGLQQGLQQGANKLAELIKTGLSVDDALKLVNGNPPVEAESG